MRQGNHGKTFYLLLDGEVEVCQQMTWTTDDLMRQTPPNYLGSTVNILQSGDYFGERALLTGEPRAASIRAIRANTTCLALDQSDLPANSVMSSTSMKKDRPKLEKFINDKYGIELDTLSYMEQQLQDTLIATQTRGSVNTPEIIRGVDTDDEIEEADIPEQVNGTDLTSREDTILTLLLRFRLIQHVSKCFDYIVQTRPVWDDAGIRRRRSLLVNRLSPAQRSEFSDAFRLIDESGDGEISLVELKRVLTSIGDDKTDVELQNMIVAAGSDHVDAHSTMTYADFMGIMAEAEFYHLFRDVFSSLDSRGTGFVKAADLDRVLCGMRDLISDDRKSIIDVEDVEMLVDYEQFTRMLLGI